MPRYEYAKVMFNGEQYSLHREWPDTPPFTGSWDNDIAALNDLAKDGWDLVTSYPEPMNEEGQSGQQRATFYTTEHVVRRDVK